MAALLTLMLVSVAGLGVLNFVVLDTRERVHDLRVCKALGMSPRQTVSSYSPRWPGSACSAVSSVCRPGSHCTALCCP
jgi:hypothetical protein